MAAVISYSMAESVGSPTFIPLGINFSDHFDHRITDYLSKQIVLNKCQAYRMNVLSFTLGFSCGWNYFANQI